MDTFNFPYHTVRTQYPQRDKMQFGNSYEFAPKPNAPMQRTFILSFTAMVLYPVPGSPDVVSATVNATKNMRALEVFYEAHETWDPFTYPHPVLGNVVVKFAQPLASPKPIEGGMGATEGFEIQLKEQP
jgi:hypothetical protein